ncbi:hypothetical protein ACWEKR_29035 [Nocardia sp. NPDC004573]
MPRHLPERYGPWKTVQPPAQQLLEQLPFVVVEDVDLRAVMARQPHARARVVAQQLHRPLAASVS